MKNLTNIKWMMLLLSLILLGACGGGPGSGGGGGSSSGSDGTGTLGLFMVDASDETFKAVYVSIKEIQVCHETGFANGDDEATCEWETIATLNKTYNLLDLVDGAMATLGQKDLEAGLYNQMRLILSEVPDNELNILDAHHLYPQYLIRLNDDIHPMKVPSGYQSGIKLVRQFEIVENKTTELILDFDVTRSIHLAGKLDKNGKYMLKPTIKVIGTYNRAEVSGIVTDEADEPLPDAKVTAWRIDNGNLIESTGTQTNAEGGYTLYLDLGGELELNPVDYLLVVTKNGYDPACAERTVEVDQTYIQDFVLSGTTNVTVSGTITGNIASEDLPDGATYPTVHLSFKQIGLCFPDPVETAFQDIGDEENYDTETGDFEYTYEIIVPAGTYDIIASTEGLTTVEILDFEVTPSDPPEPIQLDIVF
jgi:hypothetical protein